MKNCNRQGPQQARTGKVRPYMLSAGRVAVKVRPYMLKHVRTDLNWGRVRTDLNLVYIIYFVIIYIMIITYFGKQFWKIGQGEMVLAFNPVSKDSKSGISSRFGADIAFITTNHPDYNGVEQLSYGERMPFEIRGPGDYEVKEIFVKGTLSNAIIEGNKYINTIYSFAVDGINIVFLGALANSDLPKDTIEAIGNPDILFIPIGGKKDSKGANLLDSKEAAKLASTFEPRLIIPMDYDDASLKSFLKEMGEEKVAPVDKLTLKRKDLDGKEAEVVVFSTQG